MQFGRRTFLKFVGAALAGTSLDPSSTVIQKGGYFVDSRLGFGFKIPDRWYFEAFSGFKQLRDTQRLAEPYCDDQEILEELRQNLQAVISKYPITPITGDENQVFSPSITFFREDNDDLIKEHSFEEIVRKALRGFAIMLTDFECFQEPTIHRGRDFIVAKTKSRFLFEAKGMKSTLIDDEMLFVHYRHRFYTVHLYDSPYSGDTSQEEFAMFREDLHFA